LLLETMDEVPDHVKPPSLGWHRRPARQGSHARRQSIGASARATVAGIGRADVESSTDDPPRFVCGELANDPATERELA
jgi:hypothetical protein